MSEKKTWDDPELLLDQWYKYEQIAMHFNDLLMRFRTQALGGLTAVGTLATVFASAKGIAAIYLPAFFLVLACLWVAAWVLDANYYSRLLSGAVTEIRRLEKATAEDGPEPTRFQIGMSTSIDAATTDRWPNTVHWFYGIVLGALVLLCGLIRCEALTAAGNGNATQTQIAMPVTFTVDAYPVDASVLLSPPSK